MIIKLGLFGKLAATLRLAVEAPAKSLSSWPKDQEIASMIKGETEKMLPQIRKNLEKALRNAIDNGYILQYGKNYPDKLQSLNLDLSPESFAKKVERYRGSTLPNYILGAGWRKLFNDYKIPKKSEKQAGQNLSRILNNINEMMSGNVNPTHFKELTQDQGTDERGNLVPSEEKDTQLAKRLKKELRQLVGLYMRLPRLSTKDRKIDEFHDSLGFTPDKISEFVSGIVDEKMKKLQPSDITDIFTNAILSALQAQNLTPLYFVERNYAEQEPKEIILSLYGDAKAEVLSGVYRSLGKRKLKKGEVGENARFQPVMDTLFSTDENLKQSINVSVRNAVKQAVERLKTVKRGQKDDPDEGIKSQVQEGKSLTESKGKLRKQLERQLHVIEDSIDQSEASLKDFYRLLNRIEDFIPLARTETDRKAAQKLLDALKSVMLVQSLPSLADIEQALGNYAEWAKNKRLSGHEGKGTEDIKPGLLPDLKLEEIEKARTEMEKYKVFLKDVNQATRSTNALDLTGAYEILKKIQPQTKIKDSQALKNTFVNPQALSTTNARILAEILEGSKSSFFSDFFTTTLPALVEQYKSRSDAERVQNVQKGLSLPPRTIPPLGVPQNEDESADDESEEELPDEDFELKVGEGEEDEGRKKASLNKRSSRIRTGSLWIEKLYYDYLGKN